MYYMLFDGFVELLNTHRLPPSLKLDRVDGEFHVELHLVTRSDTINLSLPLIPNMVHISDTEGGGFGRTIG